MVQEDTPEDVPEGVILPPPAVQEIINKTAGYVHRNGASFETRIKEKELHNNKFQFLVDEDPYNAFYKWKLEQLKNNKLIDTTSTDNAQVTESSQEISKPKDLEFLVDFKPMSSLDHDIIKLTALYVAVDKHTGDGAFKKNFEQSFGAKNAQFGFLDPTHSLNPIFNQYVNQYLLLLRLLKEKEKSEIFAKIDLGCNSVHSLLDKSFSRAEYLQQERMKVEHKRAKDEALKLEFASIDWQDFTLVQVIEFTEEDFHSELSPPLILSELQYRSLEEKSSGLLIEEAPPDFQVVTEEPKAEDRPKRKAPKGMKIRAAGETRLSRLNEPKEKLIKCPLTGEWVAESKFQEHINILLRDPKYKEEKERYEAKVSKSNLTTDEVLNNISVLANARKIRQAKQAQSQLNTEDNSRKRPLQWDGYSASAQTIKKQAKQMYSAEEIEEQKRQRKERLKHISGSHKPQ